MRARFLLSLSLFFAIALGPPAFSQATAGPFAISSSTSPCARISVTGQGSVVAKVSGTFSITLQPELSMQGQPPDNAVVTPSTSTTGAKQGTITTVGSYSAAVGSYDTFLVCVGSYASGTATIYLNTSPAINAGLFGGGAPPSFDQITSGTNTNTLNVGSGGTLGPTGTGQITATQLALPVTSGLLGQYDFNQGAGTTLTDLSGNGNNGTFGAAGAAPTWIANTGGLLFSGGQQVTLPSGITGSVKTIQIFVSAKSTAWNSTGYNSPIISSTGNAGGSALGTGILLTDRGIVSLSPVNPPHYFNVTTWSFPSGYQTYTIGQFLGNGLVSATFDTLDHIYFNGSEDDYQNQSAVHLGSGVFQIGGGAINVGAGVDTHFTGSIYYLLLYNRVLTPTEIAANSVFVARQMQQRGISTAIGDPAQASVLLTDGDSITSVNSYPQYLGASLNTIPAYQVENKAKDGAQIVANLLPFAVLDADPALTAGGTTTEVFWAGTNDLVIASLTPTQTLAGMAAYTLQRIQKGWRVIIVPMLSRATTGDADKDLFDPLVRAQWRAFANGLADVAADPRLGADGAFSNTTWFQVDQIHPTPAAQQNITAPIIARAVNRLTGHNDFSSATTYTTGAAAATTITVATESTNTVTLTFSATPTNCVVGNQMAVSGVTPSGYNRTDYIILTRSATQVTAFNPTAGLGAGSIFGAASCPLQVDQDVYAILGGSATSPSFTLETCIGYTGQNLYLKNVNTSSPWVLTPWASETIDGAASLTMPSASSGNEPVVVLQAQIVSAAAAGCNWVRVQ